MSTRLTRGLVLLGAAAVCAACAKSESKTDSTAVSADTTAKASSAAPAPAPAALTDTSILGMLDELNAADSTNGSIAATKGTNSAVKSFGKDMMRDHHKLRASGQALAKKLNITPAPPANDTLPATIKKIGDTLNATPKGPDWDKLYINTEVNVHQFVLSFLQNAQSAATDTSLKAAITKATPIIQGHLTQAQAIQTKLNGATGATAATAGDSAGGKAGGKSGGKTP
jgi:putative membrane protein